MTSLSMGELVVSMVCNFELVSSSSAVHNHVLPSPIGTSHVGYSAEMTIPGCTRLEQGGAAMEQSVMTLGCATDVQGQSMTMANTILASFHRNDMGEKQLGVVRDLMFWRSGYQMRVLGFIDLLVLGLNLWTLGFVSLTPLTGI